jgi:hypothetical protein
MKKLKGPIGEGILGKKRRVVKRQKILICRYVLADFYPIGILQRAMQAFQLLDLPSCGGQVGFLQQAESFTPVVIQETVNLVFI